MRLYKIAKKRKTINGFALGDWVVCVCAGMKYTQGCDSLGVHKKIVNVGNDFLAFWGANITLTSLRRKSGMQMKQMSV